MHLSEIVSQFPVTSEHTVPEWAIGCFRRRSISFANGKTDTNTIVYWLQSRNFTIDLRLPVPEDQIKARPLGEYNLDEIKTLANYEGWVADTHWQDGAMSWSGGTALQLHDRWPEPGLLSRVGNCLIEHCASGSYVEDWRLWTLEPGPLVGLRLIEEKNKATGEVTHRDGGLIINGSYAGLVLGRPTTAPAGHVGKQLRDVASAHFDDKEYLQNLFRFETSVGKGSINSGFVVTDSTCADRLDRQLIDLAGFERTDERHLTQTTDAATRLFKIDTIEPEFDYSPDTPATDSGNQWFDDESKTLGRYLQICR